MKSVIIRIKTHVKHREDLLNTPEMTVGGEREIERISDRIAILEDFLLELTVLLYTEV